MMLALTLLIVFVGIVLAATLVFVLAILFAWIPPAMDNEFKWYGAWRKAEKAGRE